MGEGVAVAERGNGLRPRLSITLSLIRVHGEVMKRRWMDVTLHLRRRHLTAGGRRGGAGGAKVKGKGEEGAFYKKVEVCLTGGRHGWMHGRASERVMDSVDTAGANTTNKPYC